MTRLAALGMAHETNTFAPAKANYAAFVAGGGWPPLTTGNEIIEMVRGLNVPLAGFLVAARMDGHTPVPLAIANIPVNLNPAPVSQTPRQEDFATGHLTDDGRLAGLDALGSDGSCCINLGWEDGAESGSRAIGGVCARDQD